MNRHEYHAAEFARLAGVNKKTLLYYDEIGLFSPSRVEPNGYRVYDLFQLDRLALIASLRDLGVPLKEIRGYLTRTSPDQLDAVLAQQGAELEHRMELLCQRKKMLESVREQNREFLRYCGKGPLVLPRGAERLAVLADNGELECGIVMVNYLTDGLNTGLCVDGERSFFYQRREDGALELPAGDYICLYEDVGACGDTLQTWAEKRRPELEVFAAARGLEPERAMYIETNEFIPSEEDSSNAPLRTVRIPVKAG